MLPTRFKNFNPMIKKIQKQIFRKSKIRNKTKTESVQDKYCYGTDILCFFSNFGMKYQLAFAKILYYRRVTHVHLSGRTYSWKIYG